MIPLTTECPLRLNVRLLPRRHNRRLPSTTIMLFMRGMCNRKFPSIIKCLRKDNMRDFY